MALVRSMRRGTGRKRCLIPAVLLLLSALSAAQEAPSPSQPPLIEGAGSSPAPAKKNEEPAKRLEKQRRAITGEAASELFSMTINDSDVSLVMSGFWKGSLSFNWGIRSGPLGTAPDSGDSPLLFTQEADLSLSLWIRKKWFLEVTFLDEYNLNTYRAGYQGFPGETVQYVGIGNTGLDFPVFPYLDLGGDSSSSFGAYGRFGSGGLNLHTMVRYDAAAREERIFVGHRERTFSSLSPEKTLRGISFVLPDEGISVPVVYFQDKDGDLADSTGGRWRLARPSEYAASGIYGIVELAREAAGMAAVSYGTGAPWIASMGAYNDGSGATFLSRVQNIFDDTMPLANRTIKLEEYPQPGGGSGVPATLSIGRMPALVIYEPGTFSPFERQSRYRSPSAASEDAALVHPSSGERIDGFTLFPADNFLALDLPLYTLTGENSLRGIFELARDRQSADRRALSGLWPLTGGGVFCPEMYLPGHPVFTEDISLRFTNYGQAGAYTIGTDVIPGSVQVYRAGIPDSRISYDAGSGTVRLGSPAGFNEVIRITYLKRSEARRLGSLAAGLGLTYRPEKNPFSAEAAVGVRWNVSQEAFTEEGATSPGTAGFGGRLSWNYDRLKASVAVGLGFEQPDTTGLHRIAGMEGKSELVMALSTQRAFISEAPLLIPFLVLPGRAGLVYRNYRNSDIFGVSKLMPIDWAAPVVPGKEGPYPAEDSGTEVFTAEFGLNDPGQNWTGFQVPLGEDGRLLEQAKAIVVPLRFYDPNIGSGSTIHVIAQFGTLKDPELGTSENINLIVEKTLYSSLSPGTVPPTTLIHDNSVTITLDDAARRKLQNATHMRIIIEVSGGSFSGRLLVYKPYVLGASWRAITLNTAGGITGAEDPAVSIAEVRDPSLDTQQIRRLHPSGTNHVLQVEWNPSVSPFPPVSSAGADGRTGEIPLSQYRTASFYLKAPEALPETNPPSPASFGSFHLMVARGPSSLGRASEIALQAEIPYSAFAGLQGQWVKVELDYAGGGRAVRINGNLVPGAGLSYRPDALKPAETDFPEAGQAYIAAWVDSLSAAPGTFSLDEICLEEPVPSYRLNTGTTLAWSHPEDIVTIGGASVVSNFSVNTALETGSAGNPFVPETENHNAVQSRSQAGVTVLGTALTGNFALHLSNDTSYWSGGHGISRSFGPLSLNERFYTAPYDNIFDHRFSIGVAQVNQEVYARLGSTVNYEFLILRRAWDFSAGLRAIENGRPGFSLNGSLAYTEKPERTEQWTPDYGAAWTRSFVEMLPDTGSGDGVSGNVRSRDARGGADFTLNRTPLGLRLSFDGSTSAMIPAQLTQSLARGALEVPFAFGVLRGSLRSDRTFSRALYGTGFDITEDLERYGTALYDAAPLWRSIPVYALFDPELNGALDAALENSALRKQTENTRWSESLSLGLMFPERYDPLALILPSRFSSRIDRTLEQRLDTRLDVFSLSSLLGFSGINLFGSMGTHPLFDFYRNDEFRHSISGAASFPKGEDPVWRIQAEQNLTFFGFRGAEFGVTNTLTALSGGWIESAALVWTVPAETTLLASLYDRVMTKLKNNGTFPAFNTLAESEYECLRQETLELVIDRSGEYAEYSLNLGHESIVRIPGRLSLSAFTKLQILRNDYSSVFSCMINLGTSLTIMF